MTRPYVDPCDKKFRLQLNLEAFWHWREVRGQPSVAFAVLQASTSCIGHKLEEPARDRVGQPLPRTFKISDKRSMESRTVKKEEEKKRVQASNWVTISLTLNETMLSPNNKVEQLTEENGHLRDTVEEQAAELYWSMTNSLAHRGKEFVNVGKKQQQ